MNSATARIARPTRSQAWKLALAALALVGCRIVSPWQTVAAGFAAMVVLAMLAASIIADMPRLRKVLLLAALPLTTLVNAVVFALGAFITLLGARGLLVDGQIGNGPTWNWASAMVPLAAAANLVALVQPQLASRWCRCVWLANLASAGYAMWYWRIEQDYALIGFAVPLVLTILIGLPIVSLATLTWDRRAQSLRNSARPRRLGRRAPLLAVAVLICGALWLLLLPVYRNRQLARSLETHGLRANFGVIFPGWTPPIEVPFDLYAYLGEVNGVWAPALKGDASQAGRLLNTLPWLDFVDARQLPAGGGRILQPLAGHRRLRQVLLKGPGVTDETLADAGRIPALSWAVFENALITDEGLVSLAGATWLQFLGIRRTPISGDGLVYLQSLPRLSQLDLTGTDLEDEQLLVLPQFTALRSLSLNDTAVTDQGLASLAQCKMLKVIDLSGTRVTATGVEQIEQALPGCRVVWSRAADDP